MPCRSKGDGNYEIIDDFFMDDWLREKIAVSARASGRPGSVDCLGVAGAGGFSAWCV
jgi:hypothetical protein